MQTRYLFAGLSFFVFVLAGSGCSSAPKGKTLSASERAAVFVAMANTLLQENRVGEALVNLVEAESHDPKLPELHHSRALAYYMNKDLPSAIASARKSLTLNPKYYEGYTTLGKLLLDAGKTDEAEKTLRVAAYAEAYREAYKPMTSLGILYYRKGDLAKSRTEFDRAILSSASQSCIAYYYRGHIALRESRLKEAISDYDKARSGFCASFVDAQYALGLAYAKDKQFDQARRTFLDLQDRFPKTSHALDALKQIKRLP